MTAIKGAEATVEIKEDKVIKTRETKKYRHNKLDEKIRTERTKTEKRLIDDARKHGVKVPKAEKTGKNVLELEKIEGRSLKDLVEDSPELLEDLGENLAYLHKANIIHGDLTTSNCLVDNDTYLIDFGLAFRSERFEDKAVDIHLLKQVLNSSHPEAAKEAWNSFLEGYSNYEESVRVLKQLEEVESRGRYK